MTLRPPCLPNGAQIAANIPGLHYGWVEALWSKPDAFVSMCKIQQENEGIDFLSPTPTQRIIIDAYHSHRWNMVVKYRQAKITTIGVMLLLRDCMYLEGVKGLLVAEKQDTAEDVFERVLLAYRNLPEAVRMPLQTGRKAGVRSIHFAHGGNIKIITAGSKSPAVGRSIDRLMITEFGEAQWQKNAAIQIFPTVSKRKNARVLLESTTGRSGSHFEMMWRSAMAGQNKSSRFNPVFLKWWNDDTCAYDPQGFDFGPAEQQLLEKMEGATTAQLAFRQAALATEFVGDPRLFSSKYPMGPYDGWLGSLSPILPHDLIKALLEKSLPDPPEGDHGCCEIEPPEAEGYYVITADPAGFGDQGDKSALTVWDATRDVEVAFWEGREEPDAFARRLLRVQTRYRVPWPKPENAGPNWRPPAPRRVTLAVESNAAACIATLRQMGATNLLWTSTKHPGWYATEKRLYESEAKLVKLLREGGLTLRSRGLLHQLLDYDGSRKRRKRGRDGEMHHFDRARTAVIYADITCSRNFRRRVVDATSDNAAGELRPNNNGEISLKRVEQAEHSRRDRLLNPYLPPPSSWA